MLSSINFLFLLSLGFLSWTILCYIQQIEKFVYLNPNIPQQFSKEKSPVTIEAMKSQAETPSMPTRNNYDVYAYVMCSLVCMYVLVKITHIAEAYLAKSIRHNIYLPAVSHATSLTSSAVGNLEAEEDLKIHDENNAMELKLGVYESQFLEPANFEVKIGSLCIVNHYTQLNHDAYVDNRTVANTESVHPANIWEKYMKLRSESISNKELHSVLTPIVLSKDDFENIKATF